MIFESSQFKNKSKDLKQQRVKENKHSDTESSSSTDEDLKSRRMKSKREKPKCDYFRGSHHEKYFFKNNMDIMTKLLEENNIDFPYFARRGECKTSLEQEDGKRLYDLGAREKIMSHISISYIFVSDLHSYISDSETSILPWKKPQTVHQSFLQKLVIFH